ncbi:MarR family transcriptional regulator [Streptomyces sp. TRM66268-LWL]|uniref:MarR family transcriptional regulator n=1 Tax=Streptomyces polyasparticus TaxID=2767826 RepID=A0ABR7SKP9_9ACTN|nr:bifunctional helix-turn-helix transcriptional regulator/GNAT family N-acetyltransferase [Streptomyces polyasparticus]MBC9715076.1 MarR family transcriptional regulator [Streptomyces polyasparticus]
MDADSIAQVRRFNRTVGERIGVLHDHFLGTDRPVGEARLLWEVGEEGRDVRRLRDRLGLDSGYVSRLLRSLERDGLVTVEPQRHDRRVRTVRLTAAGRKERALLDERSDELAELILTSLNEKQRARLTAAMSEVDRLLTAGTVSVEELDPRHPDSAACLQAYFDELGDRFEEGFDASLSLVPDAGELGPPHGVFVVARLHGEPVGCGGIQFHEGEPPYIKRMWVAKSARGLGLGRRLLAELEDHAVRSGARSVRLETNRELTEAITLYRSAGYEEVPAFNDEHYAHHWFEKRLHG